jgi:hypothetical protein
MCLVRKEKPDFISIEKLLLLLSIANFFPHRWALQQLVDFIQFGSHWDLRSRGTHTARSQEAVWFLFLSLRWVGAGEVVLQPADAPSSLVVAGWLVAGCVQSQRE